MPSTMAISLNLYQNRDNIYSKFNLQLLTCSCGKESKMAEIDDKLIVLSTNQACRLAAW